MNDYEIFIEVINPCGGSSHSQNELIEAEAESPEAYVKQQGKLPILEISKNAAGDTVITTGDSNGYLIRYTFTE